MGLGKAATIAHHPDFPPPEVGQLLTSQEAFIEAACDYASHARPAIQYRVRREGEHFYALCEHAALGCPAQFEATAGPRDDRDDWIVGLVELQHDHSGLEGTPGAAKVAEILKRQSSLTPISQLGTPPARPSVDPDIDVEMEHLESRSRSHRREKPSDIDEDEAKPTDLDLDRVGSEPEEDSDTESDAPRKVGAPRVLRSFRAFDDDGPPPIKRVKRSLPVGRTKKRGGRRIPFTAEEDDFLARQVVEYENTGFSLQEIGEMIVRTEVIVTADGQICAADPAHAASWPPTKCIIIRWRYQPGKLIIGKLMTRLRAEKAGAVKGKIDKRTAATSTASKPSASSHRGKTADGRAHSFSIDIPAPPTRHRGGSRAKADAQDGDSANEPPTPRSLSSREKDRSPHRARPPPAADASGLLTLEAIFDLISRQLHEVISTSKFDAVPRRLQDAGVHDSAGFLSLARKEVEALLVCLNTGLDLSDADAIAEQLFLRPWTPTETFPRTMPIANLLAALHPAFLADLDADRIFVEDVKTAGDLRAMTRVQISERCERAEGLTPVQRIVLKHRCGPAVRAIIP